MLLDVVALFILDPWDADPLEHFERQVHLVLFLENFIVLIEVPLFLGLFEKLHLGFGFRVLGGFQLHILKLTFVV